MNKLKKIYYSLLNKKNVSILEYIDYLESTPIITDITYYQEGISDIYQTIILNKKVSAKYKFIIYSISDGYQINNDSDINKSLCSKLYHLMENNYNAYHSLLQYFARQLYPNYTHYDNIKLISERLEEFSIISNGKIDVISLQSLYEFHNKRLDIEQLKDNLCYSNTLQIINPKTNRIDSLDTDYLLCNE